MAKIEASKALGYTFEVRTDTEWCVGYIRTEGSIYMFEPEDDMVFGAHLLQDIAIELAKLNNTTLS